MLFELFSIDICSLIFDVFRLVIIVLFILGKEEFDFKVFEVKKIIVKFVQQFIYEEVQKIIDGDCLVGEFDKCILFLFKIVKKF